MRHRLQPGAGFVLSLGCACVVLAWPSVRAFAQEAQQPSPSTEPTNLSPRDFESKVAVLCRQVEGNGADPAPLVDLLAQRMRDFRVTTTQTVLEVVNEVCTLEAKRQKMARGVVRTYPSTKRLIETLLPLAADYPEAEAGLLADKASLLEQEGDLKGAVPVLQRAVTTLTPLGLEADVNRIRALNSRAEICARLGDAESAKADFNAVLSYEWYKVTDPAAFQELRDQYIRAGSGLIELDRNDLKALNEIFFVPSAMRELKPELDLAKDAAKSDAK
jgi:hypothetical protein